MTMMIDGWPLPTVQAPRALRGSRLGSIFRAIAHHRLKSSRFISRLACERKARLRVDPYRQEIECRARDHRRAAPGARQNRASGVRQAGRAGPQRAAGPTGCGAGAVAFRRRLGPDAANGAAARDGEG